MLAGAITRQGQDKRLLLMHRSQKLPLLLRQLQPQPHARALMRKSQLAMEQAASTDNDIVSVTALRMHCKVIVIIAVY